MKKNASPLPPIPPPPFFLISLRIGQGRNWYLKRRIPQTLWRSKEGKRRYSPPLFWRFLFLEQKLNSAQNCNSSVFELIKAVGKVYLLFILMNSKNINLSIFLLFSPFYSAHSVSFIKFPPFMRGGFCLSLSGKRSHIFHKNLPQNMSNFLKSALLLRICTMQTPPLRNGKIFRRDEEWAE